MRREFCILLLLSLFSIFSCTSEIKSDANIINIESNVDNWQVANLSSFAKNILYVCLQTIDSLALQGNGRMVFSENLILVRDSKNCLLYDFKGNFISKIGNQGKGPGEYLYISDMGIAYRKEPKIYISQNADLFEYSMDGSFVDKYSKSLLINDTSAARRWEIIRDSLIFGHVDNNTGKVKLKAVIKNKYGKIIKGFKNYDLLNRGARGPEEEVSIYPFKNLIYYKELENDTLFYLDNNNDLIPEYVFNLGKYKEPSSERILFPRGPSFFNYLHVWYAFQTEDQIFINCQYGNRFPAKRLSARSIGPGAPETMYNTTYALGIYNKKTKKLFFCKPTTTDNPLFTTGICNDFDAGPRFFPQAQVNDSTLVMWMTSFDLKMHIQSDDFKKSIPKFPEKKRKLEELANGLSEFDNPVLMMVVFNN